MFFLNDEHVEALEDRYGLGKLKRQKRTSDPVAERTIREIVKAVETVGAAGAMSFWNAKNCKPGRNAIEFGGVPADLTLGVVGNVVAIATSSHLGEYSEHLHNVANGLLCAYAVRMGTMWGTDARTKRTLHSQVAQRMATPQAPQQMQQQPGMLPMPQPSANGFAMYRPQEQQPAYDWAA